MFLLRLATEVNWNEEESCFEGIAMEVAEFCSIQPAVGERQAVVREEIAEEIQHRIFPWLKKRLLPPHEFASDSTLIQVACLEKLYQIFERC
jgi:DNA mismatch repair protein MLH1